MIEEEKIGGFNVMLTSEKICYRFKDFIKENKDLIGMEINEVDENLEKIEIEVGGKELITICKDTIKRLKGKNILEYIICNEEHKLPLSKSFYLRNALNFYYDKEYLKENEKYYIGDKIKKIPELEVCLVYDEETKEVMNGKRVIGWKTKIEGKMKNITVGVTVKIPEIKIKVEKREIITQIEKEREIDLVIKDDIKVKEKDSEKIEKMEKDYNFCKIEGTTKNGEYYGSIDNKIKFMNGLAGKLINHK